MIGEGVFGRISNDGRYVYYSDRNGYSGPSATWLYDRVEQTSTHISVGPDNTPLNDTAIAEGMSADGRYLLYSTAATNTYDGVPPVCAPDNPDPAPCASNLYLVDRQNPDVHELVSVNSDGEQANNGHAFAEVSDDGRYVLFVSEATNLDPCSECLYDSHLYVRDRVTGTTTRVNYGVNGEILYASVNSVAVHGLDISGNGRYAVFGGEVEGQSGYANTVYVRDLWNNVSEIVSVDTDGNLIPYSAPMGRNSISYDGRFVLFTYDYTKGDTGLIYIRDRVTGITSVVSRDADGNTGDLFMGKFRSIVSYASMSGDGSVVVFPSASDTLLNNGHTSPKLFVSVGEPVAEEPTPTATDTATETPTDEPTGTPEPINLLQNGGFEIQGATLKLAASWKAVNLTKDRRVCDTPLTIVAHEGECAFRFGATAGEISKITQRVRGEPLVIQSGETLTLIAWVRGKNLKGAQVKAVLMYEDGSSQPLKLTGLNAGTYAYQLFMGDITATADVESVKVVIQMKRGTGKFWIDDVWLYSEN
jgi:hypothetical protein